MLDTHAVARSLTDAEVHAGPGGPLTNAVRLAAEHGDHVTLGQFTASLAEVRAEIAEVRTEIAASLKRPSPSRQPTPSQVHALEEAPPSAP